MMAETVTIETASIEARCSCNRGSHCCCSSALRWNKTRSASVSQREDNSPHDGPNVRDSEAPVTQERAGNLISLKLSELLAQNAAAQSARDARFLRSLCDAQKLRCGRKR
jgi:hypothetical protein